MGFNEIINEARKDLDSGQKLKVVLIVYADDYWNMSISKIKKND